MPPTEQPPPQTQTINFATDNFRVRRLRIIADLDLYDDEGFLINRGETEAIVVNEVRFTAGIVQFIASATQLGRGFMPRTLSPPALVAVPDPIHEG